MYWLQFKSFMLDIIVLVSLFNWFVMPICAIVYKVYNNKPKH